ncbi:MAG TPA: trypsin-like peptidase domain-containing protein [Chthoniobacteraceae bacterium]|nr:trypsin-like peptidase domain-containing protein [Chthoniobacteraceae bacterium]
MKRFLIFVAVIALIVYGLSRWNASRTPNAPHVVPEVFTPATPKLDLNGVEVLTAMDEEYTRLAEAVMPSVVSIYTSRVVHNTVPDPFEFFFGPRRGRGPMGRDSIQNSLGSGVIVSKEGHVLTNNHVVADTDDIKVKLRDGREFTARLIGNDPKVDIAVLKIDADNIEPLALGDSDRIKVGSLVLAIGNPFGLQETVTHGMISAMGRQLSDENSIEFLQTDTAINPGNSGGPLVNLRGEVIGINTAIGNFSGSGTWQGVGFAIPSNAARRSMESIIQTGRVVYGYLGVAVDALTPERAAQLGLKTDQGALVEGVMPGSPAEKGGIEAGDVIVSFNGDKIDDVRQLLRQVSKVAVGSTVKVEVIRNGEKKELEALIEEQPADFQSEAPAPAPNAPSPFGQPGPRSQQRPGPRTFPFQQPFRNPRRQPQQPQQPQPQRPAPEVSQGPLAGIEVASIPEDRRSDYPENVNGVLVTSVDPSLFRGSQLRPGDVIEEIARQPVESVEDFREIAASLEPGQSVLISICRGKARSFVVVP